MISEPLSATQNLKKRPRTIEEQVALDLASYLDRFPNKNFAIRILSKETELHEKTIKRLLNRQNKPTYQTLAKLYFSFLDLSNYQELLAKCPPVVAEFLKTYTPPEATPRAQRADLLSQLFKKEPLAAEIFVLAGTGPLELNKIRLRYGLYGVEALRLLEQEKLLVETDKGKFSLAPTIPSMSGETLKILGELFIRRFSKPRDVMSENSISFYAEGLNEEGLKQWLAVDSEAFYKKLKIAQNSAYQGGTPVFTFCATDRFCVELE